MPLESADLLIEARWVLPIAPANTVLADHAVVVTDGRIAALGPIPQMNARFAPRQRIVRRQHALLPGFVNAHTCAAMTLLRGLPVWGPPSRWLREIVQPAEQRCMSPDFVRAGTKLAIAEMLQAGITSFADSYCFPEEVARVAAAARMRVAVGLRVSDPEDAQAPDATAQLAQAERLWDRYCSDPWVSLYFAPVDAAGTSDDTLTRMRRVADELDARMAGPVHATAVELQASLSRHGDRPLRRLERLGLLRPGFTAVHLSHLDEDDLQIVAATGIHAVICPQADLRLGSTAGPIRRLLDQHVGIGLGCGNPAAAGALDILAEARAAALAANVEKETGAGRAEEALRMATLGGALALGAGAVTGSIEPGKSADLLCMDLDALACQPAMRPADSIVFAATRQQARDVWTSGRAVVSGGHLLAFDEQELSALARQWAQRTGTGASS